jgi:catechol 2,3-dioxygenase-like lactoylglutathione lyase family enzyme
VVNLAASAQPSGSVKLQRPFYGQLLSISCKPDRKEPEAKSGPAKDIQRAIAFYTQRLGFKLAFGDKADPPNYVGFRRDAVELHMQFQFEHEMGTIRLRFLVDDPDALFSEYRQRGVECNPNSVHNTSWGTREFALYDLDRNALTFYRDLTSAEKEGRMVESSQKHGASGTAE